MAKFISYKKFENYNNLFKLHPSDKSKLFWNKVEPSLFFTEITEEQFKKIQYGYEYNITNEGILEIGPSVTNKTFSFTRNKIYQILNEHIEKLKYFIENNENPHYSQNDVNYLKNIDLNQISFPISVPYDSWVLALESSSNQIKIDTFFEIS
jgi:hypothetical protein